MNRIGWDFRKGSVCKSVSIGCTFSQDSGWNREMGTIGLDLG